MTKEFVRHKEHQEPVAEIEYRIEDHQIQLVAGGDFYTTYGIAVYRKGHKLRCLKDITTEKTSLERLVDLCNREGLSLCHLDDVVEDFLGVIYGGILGSET